MSSMKGERESGQEALPESPIDTDTFAVSLDSRHLKARALTGSASIAVVQAISAAMQFGMQLVLARLLLPGDFGLIAMAAPVIGAAQLFTNVGLAEIIIQRRSLRNSQVSTLFWLTLTLSVALAGLVCALAPWVATFYDEPALMMVMVMVSLTMPLGALAVVPSNIIARRMEFTRASAIDLTSAILGAVATVFAALLGASYWSIVIGQLTGTTSRTSLFWWAARWRPCLPAFGRHVRKDLHFGLNLTWTQMALYVVSNGDNIAIGILAGKDVLGLYDRSYKLVVLPVAQAMAPFSRIAVPLLSRLQDERDRYRRAYITMVRLTMLMTIPPMVVCIAHPTAVVVLLLGEGWRSAAPFFALISVGGVTSGLFATLAWLFISQDRTGEYLRMTIVTAILGLSSVLVGAIWGATGIAAVTSFVFVLIITPMALVWATSSGHVRLKDLTPTAWFYITGTLSAGLLVWLVSVYGPTGTWLSVLVAASAACIPFVAIAAFGQSERVVIASAWRVMRRVTSRSALRAADHQ